MNARALPHPHAVQPRSRAWPTRSLLATASLIGFGITTQGHATALTAGDILGQFNAVISGNFTSNSDVEGRLVANALQGGSTFYLPRGTAVASSFGVVNAITVGSGVTNANVNNGGNVDVQGSNQGHFNLNGGGRITSTPAFAITDFTTPLNALTSQLAGLSANSTINASDPNNFTFNETPDASGTAVFKLDSSTLASARNLVFNGTASTIIINVTGTSYVDTTNFNTSAYFNQHVIWDFAQATSLSFQNWHGSVLAPLATVSNSSAMEGTLYARNFNGSGELHDFTFAGTLPAQATSVPEPASASLLGCALLSLGIVSSRRRKRT